MKKDKGHNLWPLKITVFTFFLSVAISIVTSVLIKKVSVIYAFIVLICVVLIGIIFDVIGIAVTTASEIPFHSRNAKGINGGKEAINLIRNAEKVSNICNDVIGDTVGVISGGLAGAIVAIVVLKYKFLKSDVLNLTLAGLVAAITVGGKAVGKTLAISKGHDIVKNVGIFIYYIKNLNELFTLNKKNNKQRKNDN